MPKRFHPRISWFGGADMSLETISFSTIAALPPKGCIRRNSPLVPDGTSSLSFVFGLQKQGLASAVRLQAELRFAFCVFGSHEPT